LCGGGVGGTEGLNRLRDSVQPSPPVKTEAGDVVDAHGGAAGIQHVDQIAIDRHTDRSLSTRKTETSLLPGIDNDQPATIG
jgi:hypothetical protein